MIYKTILTKLFYFTLYFLMVLCPTIGFSLSTSDLVDLRYPSAYDFVKKKNGINLEYSSYKVNRKYPSLEVYYYYKKFLEELSFKEIDLGDNDSLKWFSFVDGTLKEQPVVHQFRAIWVDKGEKEMCVLVIDYYSRTERSEFSTA